MYRQGDVLIVPIDESELPSDLIPAPRDRSGRLVLAYGEATGHAHAILDESAELVTDAHADELYLLVHGPEPVALVHDEHDTLAIPPGRYKVVRQREYVPDPLAPARWVAD